MPEFGRCCRRLGPPMARGPFSIAAGANRRGNAFIFKEPLGQAREVKVALSGLFGRFVARA